MKAISTIGVMAIHNHDRMHLDKVRGRHGGVWHELASLGHIGAVRCSALGLRILGLGGRCGLQREGANRLSREAGEEAGGESVRV